MWLCLSEAATPSAIQGHPAVSQTHPLPPAGVCPARATHPQWSSHSDSHASAHLGCAHRQAAPTCHPHPHHVPQGQRMSQMPASPSWWHPHGGTLVCSSEACSTLQPAAEKPGCRGWSLVPKLWGPNPFCHKLAEVSGQKWSVPICGHSASDLLPVRMAPTSAPALR